MAVWPSVRDTFPAFTKRFEGFIPWLYEDVGGLMTTGVGNLVDTRPPSPSPTAAVLVLPWLRPDGSAASPADIAAAWAAVRARPDLRPKDGRAYESVTSIRLKPETISTLVQRKFDEHDGILSARFPSYSEWPAAAQLALHAMSWQLGPRFRFPQFEASANASPPDFDAMAKQCVIQGGHPVRNAVNQSLFQAAADAQKNEPEDKWAQLSVAPKVLFGAEAVVTAPAGIHPRWDRILAVFATLGVASAGSIYAARAYRNASSPGRAA